MRRIAKHFIVAGYTAPLNFAEGKITFGTIAHAGGEGDAAETVLPGTIHPAWPVDIDGSRALYDDRAVSVPVPFLMAGAAIAVKAVAAIIALSYCRCRRKIHTNGQC